MMTEEEPTILQNTCHDVGIDYDDILKSIGPTGKYSRRTFIPLIISSILPGMIVMSYTFTTAIPEYRCYIPVCDNYTTKAEFHPHWINNAIPWKVVNKTLNQCQHYNSTWTDYEECTDSLGVISSNDLLYCNQWVYDNSIFRSTIVTEFDLACNQEWKATLPSIGYMAGMLIGFASVGILADVLGRKSAFTIISIFLASAFTVCSFSPNYATFVFLSVLTGAGGGGFYLAAFVWGIEEVSTNHRTVASCVSSMLFTVGVVAVGIIAYFVRDWRTLQLICGVPVFIFASYYWFIPESSRWLIMKGRHVQAKQQILQAAQMNGRTIPDDLLNARREMTPAISASPSQAPLFEQVIDLAEPTVDVPAQVPSKESLLDIFRSGTLRRRTLILISSWMAIVMAYYGLTMNSSNLAGDLYLNYELSAIVEIPATVAGVFLMNYCGRRATLSGCLFLSGASCIAAGLVTHGWSRIGLSILGKAGVSCAFPVIYCFTAELFSTSTRGAAVGLCSTCGRIGGVAAPFIAASSRIVNPGFPFYVFGSCSLFSACLALLLPETKGTRLAENVHQAKQFEEFRLRFTGFRRKATSVAFEEQQ